MMFGVASSVLLSPLRSGGVLSCAYRTNVFVFPPLCTSAHFQHSHLQSIIRRYDIPASLISIQHWCFLWTCFVGMARDIISDNIWQIDEVNVSFPNFSLLCVFIEQIVLYFLLVCPFIICISLPKLNIGHSTGGKAVFSTCSTWGSYTTNAIILFWSIFNNSHTIKERQKHRYIKTDT